MNTLSHAAMIRARIAADLASLRQHEAVDAALSAAAACLPVGSDLRSLIENARDFFNAEQNCDGEAMEEAASFLHRDACDIQRAVCS